MRLEKFENSAPLLGTLLIVDTVLLSIFLGLTGGPLNPLSSLYLVPIAIAAVALSARWTWFLAGFSSLCFALLFRYHLALPFFSEELHHSGKVDLHLYGMLVAFIITAVLVAFFLTRLTAKLREREAELRLLQRQRLINQRLASLTTLSAGAAHELSSPLSTIAVVAKELEQALQETPLGPLTEDATLIQSEVERCRSIIDRMGISSGELKGELPKAVSAKAFIEELHKEFARFPEGSILLDSEPLFDELIVPDTGLRQALLAIVQNALDASSKGEAIQIGFREQEDWNVFEVRDQGSGMSEETLERATEPFFTTKEPGRGMGLGLFLVKLFSENWGGSLSIDSQPEQGTTVRLFLPRSPAVKAVSNYD